MAAAVPYSSVETPPSCSFELLGAKDAAQFYEEACRSKGLHIHSTFLKQLLHETVLIQFENGYLGGSGIFPIVQTLQRIPLRGLLLSRCALSSEDVKLLCSGLAHHPQLEKIDVRGVDLTIGAVKELLHLAVRNPHITEILMDERLPKFVAIQQQCQRNAQAAVSGKMSACVVCGAGVSVEARASCETMVLRFVLEHLKPHTCSISAAGLTMLCGALQQCVDRNDGILSVCGEACGETLAEDLCRCVWSVAKRLVWQASFDAPTIPFLRAYLSHQLDRFERELGVVVTSSSATASSLPAKSFFQPGPMDAQAEECWRTKKPRSDIDDFFDNRADRDVSPCTVCGQPSVCSTDGATWLLRTLQVDLDEHNVAVTPAGLLRLCAMLTTYASVQPCSRRCLRHLLRYALYGYGGVNCSYVGGFPPLTSVLGGAQELLRLPLVDFTVIDVAAEVVNDVASEEINCAVTVASAISDTDGVPMDPYLIFAIGRQLRKMPPTSIGMDLASACEAVRLVGCLPEKDAPFKRSCLVEETDLNNRAADAFLQPPPLSLRPPRDLVADWSTWSAASGQTAVTRWLHVAFAHRRQRVCAVDGPHRDLFDNIRAALWALRQQSRSILVTVKLALSWLSLKDGVVPVTASAHTHGFCTTAKVIGQLTLANTVLLILQCPLGRHVGHNGYLYMPKTVFLQCVRGLAFVFVDAVTMEYRAAGWRASFYANELVGPLLGVTDTNVQQLRRLFIYVKSYTQGRRHMEDAGWKLVGSRVPSQLLKSLFDADHLPPALAFLREALGVSTLGDGTAASALTVAASQENSGNGRSVGDVSGVLSLRNGYCTYWERILLSSRYPSQLLFYFSEMLGSGRWLQQAVGATAQLKSLPATAAEVVPPSPSASEEPHIESPPLPSEAATATKRMIAGADNNGGAVNRRVWQTLGSVPVLSNLSYDPAFPAEAAKFSNGRVETVSPAKGGRRKVNVQASATNTSATTPTPSSAANSRRQSLRASTPLPSSPTQRRVGSAPTADGDIATPLPNHTTPTTTPTQEAEGKGAGNRPLNVAFTPISGPMRSTTQDKHQLRLQKIWKAERAMCNALLQDASHIGVVEYLRTRTQSNRVGASSASTERPATAEELRAASENGNSNAGNGAATSSSSLQQAHEKNDIPLHLLGKPWFVIPMHFAKEHDVDEAAPSPDVHLLFIGNSFSVYSLSESRLLCGPTLMVSDALTAAFPFAGGVDAATLHPTNVNLAFFFSGREWLLFDLQLLECVDGPYPLHMHGQFRKLPAAFLDGIDSVIAIPDSSKLVFFRGYAYVVFDVLTRRCVGGVGQLDEPQLTSAFTATAVAAAELAVARSTTASTRASASALSRKGKSELVLDTNAAHLGRCTASPHLSADAARNSNDTTAGGVLSGSNIDSDADTAADGAAAVPSSSSPLHISVELQLVLGTAPMTWFKTRSGTAAGTEPPTSHWLVSRRGEVVEVEWEIKIPADTNNPNVVGAGQEGGKLQWVLRCCNAPATKTVTTTTTPPPFAHLPLLFHQSSPNVLPVLCALAVQANFALDDVNRDLASCDGCIEGSNTSPPQLELFDPEQGQREMLPSARGGSAAGIGGFSSSTAISTRDSLSTTIDSPSRTHRLRASSAAGFVELSAATTTPAAASRGVADPPPTTIMSSLTATAVAQRMPLALSRSGTIVSSEEDGTSGAAAASGPGGVYNWGEEVFFYGSSGTEGVVSSSDGSNSSKRATERAASPQFFIEYDLGLSASRRIFSALLLVLDTSLLPSVVLQLAPLTASVECSVEGEVYIFQAVLRITGAVTAARWGGGPLTVDPGAARFWRLRFHTPIPAVVGIVRLFWFEAPHRLLRQTVPSVPLSPCVALPLTLRKLTGKVTREGGEGCGSVPPISIEAAFVVASPELLLSRDNMLPVFVDDPSRHSRGWYDHHTTFPLLTTQQERESSACLVCCGASCIELHLEPSLCDSSDVAQVPRLPPSATSQCFADDPRFAGLPYPFVLGWDATFYPSPHEEPGLLCLLRGDIMLLWDVVKGVTRGDAVGWRYSALLDGLCTTTPIARAIATVNCWSKNDGKSVVAFFYEESSAATPPGERLRYLEFDLEEKQIVCGPVSLASHLRSRYGVALPAASSESTLLTVLCSPQAPLTLYMFYEKMVQVLTVKSPGGTTQAISSATSCAPSIPLADSPLFFAVPLLLPKWGTRQRHCYITLDLESLLLLRQQSRSFSDSRDTYDEDNENEGALVAGMQFISSGGRSGAATRWKVQCSERGLVWEEVAVHLQKAGERVIGETMWAPRATGCFSNARFWRFTRIVSGDGNESTDLLLSNTDCSTNGNSGSDACLQSYSQLRLLSIPRRRFRQLPVRVSGTDSSACSNAECNAFFIHGTRASNIELRPQTEVNAAYELVWDYGLSMVVLSGVAFTVESKPANAQLTWTVCGSSGEDSEHWIQVATTTNTSDATRYSLSWVPNGPYRYWRLACTATQLANHNGSSCGGTIGRQQRKGDPPPALKLSAFRAYTYEGPFVSLQSSTGVHLNATWLLWPSARKAAAVPSNFTSSVNSSVLFNRIAEAVTWCKIDFLVSGDCTASVAMEWSENATEWHVVALVTFSLSDAAVKKVQQTVLSWQSCGPRQMWRIRVLDINSDVTFLPVRLYLGTSPAERLVKLSPREMLLDATIPVQPVATLSVTPATSRRSSVQMVVNRPPSVGSSVAAAMTAAPSDPIWPLSATIGGGATAGADAGAFSSAASAETTDLYLESPQRLIGVRASLPSATARYAVEYLGLDGVSWLLAAVLEGGANTQKESHRKLLNGSDWTTAHTPMLLSTTTALPTSTSTAPATSLATPANAVAAVAVGVAAAGQDSVVTSVWWDGVLVSPSTQWRLRLLPKSVNATCSQLQKQLQQQKVRAVEWFADVSTTMTTVDTSEVPGVMVSTTGFTEVQAPHCLSGTNQVTIETSRSALKAAPVLQCTVSPTRSGSLTSGPVACTATWSFNSPILLDQITLHLRATAKALRLTDDTNNDDDADSGDPVAAALNDDVRAVSPRGKSETPVQSVWVETSDNGEDFVAVAHTLLWPTDTTVTLTWEEVPSASFWRLRLSKASLDAASLCKSSSSWRYVLDIFAARWAVRRTSPAVTAHMRSAPPGSFTNTAYRAWLTERFNNEDAFMRDCRDAFDEFCSTESKLRAAEMLSAPAMLAAAVQKMRMKYQVFIQKTAKEATRQPHANAKLNDDDDGVAGAATDKNKAVAISGETQPSSLPPPSSMAHRSHARWLSPPEYASSDVMLLLLESAANMTLGGDKLLQLAELVNHPLALREAFKFTKKTTRWFYPYLEVVGQLAHEWYGFSPDDVCASFCVYWSLSAALQRRKDVLLSSTDLILPLSEHVASPLVVVQINEVNWSPSQHFPGVPFLYVTSFHEQPTTVVFALNDVVFTPPYALGIPSAKESEALTSPYPYTLYAGVNFVQTRTLDSCPAPVFDVLRFILPPSLFRSAVEEKTTTKTSGRHRTNNNGNNNSGKSNANNSNNNNNVNNKDGSLVLMVLTTPSAQQSSGSVADGASAQLRFTVPADGVNFGLRGLVIDTLEFEITMRTDGAAKRWAYQTTFVSHGARFVAQGKDAGEVVTEVPVSLLGSVETHGLPVVRLRGSLGNVRLHDVAELPGAVVTNVFFYTIAQVRRAPPQQTQQIGAHVNLSDREEVSGDAAAAATAIAPLWVCFPLQAEARVSLSGLQEGFSCTCILNTSNPRDGALAVSQLELALPRSSLSATQALCYACFGGGCDGAVDVAWKHTAVIPELPSQEVFDICGVHVQLAATLKVAASLSTSAQQNEQGRCVCPTFHGQGLLYIDNNVLQGATVEINCESATVTVLTTCTHPLRFGALVVQGSEESPILLQLLLSTSSLPQREQQHKAADRGPSNTPPTFTAIAVPSSYNRTRTAYASHRLLVTGSAYLFGTYQPARVSLELTRATETGHCATFVAHSLRHPRLEAMLQDSAVSLAWRYAQVTVDEAAFRQALTRELGNVPVVASLRAHGIPLTCVVASVAAAPFDLVTQHLSLRVKGLLFGASFDAVTSVFCPDDVEDVWTLLAAHLCPEIVEQCEENLWASYANVVGCRIPAPHDADDM